MADQFIYANGTLCYILDQKLRVLRFHESTDTELVVDIRKFLATHVVESDGKRLYKFRVVHYAHGIVSCLYTHTWKQEPFNLIVVFDLHKGKFLTKERISSFFKLFVRNTEKYLWMGAQAEVGDDGFRRWMVKVYSIEEDKWFDKLVLADVVGSELNSTVCFEIIDDYFYGISSQTMFIVEQIDWTSFYHCFRYPVDKPFAESVEILPKKLSWRRQHADGVIDDRWSFMMLRKDEETGELILTESRKEWPDGQSQSRRSYYSMKIDFSTPSVSEPDPLANGQRYGDSSTFPNDVLARMRNENSRSNFHERVLRPAKFIHHGDDWQTRPEFTLSKTPLRTYDLSCQTWIDLVDDSEPSPLEPTQRIRLRSGHRRRRYDQVTGCPGGSGNSPPPTTQDEIIEREFSNDEVLYWPPEQHPTDPDDRLDDLLTTMNPTNHLGYIMGTSDSRCVVYTTGGDAKNGIRPLLDSTERPPMAILYLSWDPSVRLASARKWGPGGLPGQPHGRPLERQEKETTPSTRLGKRQLPEDTFVANAGHPHHTSSPANPMKRVRVVEKRPPCKWIEEESALHHDIGMGFDFTAC